MAYIFVWEINIIVRLLKWHQHSPLRHRMDPNWFANAREHICALCHNVNRHPYPVFSKFLTVLSTRLWYIVCLFDLHCELLTIWCCVSITYSHAPTPWRCYVAKEVISLETWWRKCWHPLQREYGPKVKSLCMGGCLCEVWLMVYAPHTKYPIILSETHPPTIAPTIAPTNHPTHHRTVSLHVFVLCIWNIIYDWLNIL